MHQLPHCIGRIILPIFSRLSKTTLKKVKRRCAIFPSRGWRYKPRWQAGLPVQPTKKINGRGWTVWYRCWTASASYFKRWKRALSLKEMSVVFVPKRQRGTAKINQETIQRVSEWTLNERLTTASYRATPNTVIYFFRFNVYIGWLTFSYEDKMVDRWMDFPKLGNYTVVALKLLTKHSNESMYGQGPKQMCRTNTATLRRCSDKQSFPNHECSVCHWAQGGNVQDVLLIDNWSFSASCWMKTTSWFDASPSTCRKDEPWSACSKSNQAHEARTVPERDCLLESLRSSCFRLQVEPTNSWSQQTLLAFY